MIDGKLLRKRICVFIVWLIIIKERIVGAKECGVNGCKRNYDRFLY